MLQQVEDVLAAKRHLAAGRGGLLRHFVDVGASDERLLTRSSDQHDADVVVVAGVEQRLTQLAHRRGVQCIEHRRTVDGDEGDMTLAGHEQIVERHEQLTR